MISVRIGGRTFRVKDMRGWKSAIGLMFDSESEGALIDGNSIWMPFVTSPLHLYFLDRGFRIVRHEFAVPLTINPATWKIYSCRDARYCLELREKVEVEKGERVEILG